MLAMCEQKKYHPAFGVPNIFYSNMKKTLLQFKIVSICTQMKKIKDNYNSKGTLRVVNFMLKMLIIYLLNFDYSSCKNKAINCDMVCVFTKRIELFLTLQQLSRILLTSKAINHLVIPDWSPHEQKTKKNALIKKITQTKNCTTKKRLQD